jgi:hypothetical protein
VSDDRPPRFLSLFAGIGGFDEGLRRAGWECAAAVEVDASCRDLLAARFPGLPLHADIADFDGIPWRGSVELVCGGFPCFPAGTLILTERGTIPIENVMLGDRVLTHRGRWQEVTRHHGHRSAATVRLKGHGHPGLVTTPEHPFWASRRRRVWRNWPTRGWDPAFDAPDWRRADGMVGRTWATPAEFPPSVIPPMPAYGRERSVSMAAETLCWLLGAWLGNGWVTINRRRGQAIWCDGFGQWGIRDKLDESGLHYTQDLTGRTAAAHWPGFSWNTADTARGTSGFRHGCWACPKSSGAQCGRAGSLPMATTAGEA